MVVAVRRSWWWAPWTLVGPRRRPLILVVGPRGPSSMVVVGARYVPWG